MEEATIWPIIDGVRWDFPCFLSFALSLLALTRGHLYSSQGKPFHPKEKGIRVKMQVFKAGRVSWSPVWLELNGHAICVYDKQQSAAPSIRFALQECKLSQAVMGLSGNSIDTKAPLLCIVSRFHVDVSTNDSLFFFQCANMGDRDDFLKAYLVNHEWAKRYSGFIYPNFAMDVSYAGGAAGEISCVASKEKYMRKHRFHMKPFRGGALDDGGAGRWPPEFTPRWAEMGADSLQFYTKKDGDVKGTPSLMDAVVVVICNDVLTTGVAKEPARNWFGWMDATDQVWVCRAGTSSDLERWLYALEKASGHHELEEGGSLKVVELLERKYDNSAIRYSLHSFPDANYPSMERKPMPGRPTSGTIKPGTLGGTSLRGASSARTPVSPRGRGRGTVTARALPSSASAPADRSLGRNTFSDPSSDVDSAAAAAAALTQSGTTRQLPRGQVLTTKGGTKIATKNPRLTSLANRAPPSAPKGGATGDKSPVVSPRGSDRGTMGRSSNRNIAGAGGKVDSSAAERLKHRLEKKKGEMVAEKQRRSTLMMNESEDARLAAVNAVMSKSTSKLPSSKPPMRSSPSGAGGASAAELQEFKLKIKQLEENLDKEVRGRKKLFEYEKKMMERVEELETEEQRLLKLCQEKDVVIQTWQSSHKKASSEEEELRDKISLLEIERNEFKARIDSMDREMGDVQGSMQRTAESAQQHMEKLKAKIMQEKKLREQDQVAAKEATRSVNELRLRTGELEEQNENYRHQLGDLRAKSEEAEASHSLQRDKLEDDVSHFRQELEDARDALSDAEKEQSRLEGEVSGLTRETAALQKQISMLENVNDRTQESSDQRLADARQQLAQKEGALAKEMTTVSQLRQELEAVSQKVSTLKNDKQQLQSQAEQSARDRQKREEEFAKSDAALKNDLQTRMAECTRLSKNVVQLEGQIASLDAKVADLEGDKVGLDDELAEVQELFRKTEESLTEELRTARATLKEKESEVLALTGTVAKTTSQVEMLTDQVSNLRDEKGKTEERLHEVSTNSSKLQAEAAAAQTALQGSLTEKAREADQLTADLAQRDSELSNTSASLQATEATLQETTEKLEETRKELKERVATLAQTEEDLANTVNSLNDTAAELETSVQTLAATKEEMEQRLADALKQREEAEAALQKQIAELQGIRSSMGDAVEELSKEIEELQEQNQDFEEDLARKEQELVELTELLKTTQATMDEQGEELGNTIAMLDGDLSSTRETLEETKAARDQLQEDLEKRRQEHADSKEKLEGQLRELKDAKRLEEERAATEKAELRKNLASMTSKAESLGGSETQLQQDLSNALEELAEANADIEALEDRIDVLLDQVDEITEEREIAYQEIEVLEENLDKARAEFAREKATAEKKVEALEERLEKFKQEVREKKDVLKDIEGTKGSQIKELQRDVKEAQREAANAKKAEEKAKRDLEKQREQFDKKKEEFAVIEAKLGELTEKFSKLGIERLELEKQMNASEERANVAETARSKAQAAMEHAQESAEQSKREVTMSREDSENEIGRLMAESEHLSGVKRELTARLEALESDKKRQQESLKGQIDQLKEQLDEAKNALPEMQERMREIEQEKMELNARIGVSKDKQKMAQETLDTYKKKIGELEPKLRLAETDTVKLQSQLEMTAQEKDRLLAELKELQETHRADMKDASKAREASSREFMQAQTDLKDMEMTVRELEEQIKAKEAGASEEVKALKEQLRNAKLKADESKALSDAAYKQLSEAKEELAQMEEDLEDLEEKARAGVVAAKDGKQLDSQLKQVKAALKAKEVEARELDSQLMSFKNKAREMQMEFADDYGEVEMALQKALLQLEIAKESEGESGVWAARADSLQMELDAFAEAAEIDHESQGFIIADLEEDLERATSQFKAVSSEYDKLLKVSLAQEQDLTEQLTEAAEEVKLAQKRAEVAAAEGNRSKTAGDSEANTAQVEELRLQLSAAETKLAKLHSTAQEAQELREQLEAAEDKTSALSAALQEHKKAARQSGMIDMGPWPCGDCAQPLAKATSTYCNQCGAKQPKREKSSGASGDAGLELQSKLEKTELALEASREEVAELREEVERLEAELDAAAELLGGGMDSEMMLEEASYAENDPEE